MKNLTWVTATSFFLWLCASSSGNSVQGDAAERENVILDEASRITEQQLLESFNCAPAALYFAQDLLTSQKLPYSQIISLLGQPNNGQYSMLQIKKAAQAMSLLSVGLNLNPRQLLALDTISIVHLKRNPYGYTKQVGHYVLVAGYDPQKGYITILDGLRGPNVVSMADFTEYWTGRVLVLFGPDDRDKYKSLLSQYGQRRRTRVYFLSALGVLAGLLMVIYGKRFSKRSANLFVIIFVAMLVRSGEAALLLEREYYDLGVTNFDYKKRIEVSVPCENASDKNISLRVKNRSCGCHKVKFSKETLKPGERADINISLGNISLGPQIHTIDILEKPEEKTHGLAFRTCAIGYRLARPFVSIKASPEERQAKESLRFEACTLEDTPAAMKLDIICDCALFTFVHRDTTTEARENVFIHKYDYDVLCDVSQLPSGVKSDYKCAANYSCTGEQGELKFKISVEKEPWVVPYPRSILFMNNAQKRPQKMKFMLKGFNSSSFLSEICQKPQYLEIVPLKNEIVDQRYVRYYEVTVDTSREGLKERNEAEIVFHCHNDRYSVPIHVKVTYLIPRMNP